MARLQQWDINITLSTNAILVTILFVTSISSARKQITVFSLVVFMFVLFVFLFDISRDKKCAHYDIT